MDKTILDLSRQKIEYAALGEILEGDPDALLFVSFTGDDEDELVAVAAPARPRCGERHGHGYHTLRADRPRPSRRRCSRCASPASGC